MGMVYLAFDERLERYVAIKRLHVATDYSQQQKRLTVESKLLAKINHPAIVQIYDVIEKGCELMLVIEYVDGGNLASWFAQRHADTGSVLDMAIRIVEGLHAAHSVGVIHRDLKSENVLVDRSGAVKITDFGIAKSLLNDMTSNTEEGMVIGSLEAMAPEQLLGKTIDHRCDLFAFGLLLFRLLSGKCAFEGAGGEGSQFERILYAQVDFKRCPETTPAPLILLLRQLLEKRVELRPANAAVVLETLRRIRENSNQLSPTVSHPQARPTKLFSKVSFTRLYLGLFAVILLLFVLFYIVTWNTPNVSRYIAVPTPEVLDYASPYDVSLVSDAVLRGIQEGVLSMSGASLVMGDELSMQDGWSDIEHAHASGAHELIRSRLRCQQSMCELFLARIRVEDTILISKAKFSVPMVSLMQLHQLVTGHSQGLLNEFEVIDEHNDLRISTEGYQQYLELNQTIKPRVANITAIHELLVLQEEWPNFLPAYDLITNYYLDRYGETRDPSYLGEAQRVLERGLVLKPEAAPIQFNLLRVALKKPHDASLLKDFERLETQGVDASNIAALRSEYWEKRGEFTQAIDTLNKALALRRSVSLFYRKALLQWRMGAMKDVRTTLNEVLILAPDYLPAIGLLADSALMAGEAELAIRQYSNLLLLQDSSLNHNNLGLAYYLQGDFAFAQKSFEIAVSGAPEKPLWLLNLADSEWLSGKHELALEHYRQVLGLLEEETIKDSQFYAGKAQALIHLGKEEESVININKALQISPESVETRYVAALIFTLLGEPVSASVHRKHALAGGISERWFHLPWFSN